MANVYRINRGEPFKLLDAYTGTDDHSSDWTALPTPRAGDAPMTIAWQSYFAVAPGAVSLQLQGAMNAVDAEAFILDTSTDVNGAVAHVSPIACRFIRARQVSKTGGTAFTTVQVQVS
jgi:hypothetical protein